jgi:uncharacterized protein (DUF983 family)
MQAIKRNTTMFGKGSIIYSVAKNKCPRCQEGDFFKNSKAYKLGTFTEMNINCSSCGLKYEIEPGFFYGAMYVSYALNVAWFVTLWVATSVLVPEMTKMTQFLIIALSMITMYPLMYRYARLLYTNIFVKYKKA